MGKEKNREESSTQSLNHNDDYNIMQNKLHLLNNLQSSSICYEAKRSILYYIAGYIVRKINLNYESCKESLL